MKSEQKLSLFFKGLTLLNQFCDINKIERPNILLMRRENWLLGNSNCAYYRWRNQRINICLERCAAVGIAGPAWSYPGYTVDRTPYGVLQHELGHHVDCVYSEKRSLMGHSNKYGGNFSFNMMVSTGEPKLTNYSPNHMEWFAEHFRLFMTNPDLLRQLRPKVYDELSSLFEPVITESWDVVLNGAPNRTFKATQRKVEKCHLI